MMQPLVLNDENAEHFNELETLRYQIAKNNFKPLQN